MTPRAQHQALDVDAIEALICAAIYADDRQTMKAAGDAVAALDALVAEVRRLRALLHVAVRDLCPESFTADDAADEIARQDFDRSRT